MLHSFHCGQAGCSWTLKVAISSIFSYIFFHHIFSPHIILLTQFAWNIWRYFCGEAFKEFSTQLNSRWMIFGSKNGWWCFFENGSVFVNRLLKMIFSWPLIFYILLYLFHIPDHFWCFREYFAVLSSGYPLQLNWHIFSIIFLSAQSIVRFSKARL